MYKSIHLALFAILLSSILAVFPVRAVTDGELDGDNHPHVVLLLMEQNGQPAFRCSATLLSPFHVLTAGHCTGAPGEFSGMRVFIESDVDNGDNSYPFTGNNSVEAKRWSAHPDYDPDQFALHDIGMIELESPFIWIHMAYYPMLEGSTY